MRRRKSSGGDGHYFPIDIRSEGNEEKPMSINPISATATMAESSPYDRSSAGLRHYRRFYFLHSASILAVLVLGIIHNGGNRKYIPVNQKELFHLVTSQASKVASSDGVTNGDDPSEMKSCRKAYVNVHSSTMEEDFAAICCSDSDYSSSSKNNERQYHTNLCDPRIPIIGISTQQLPFAGRLTRLTEAWVLPLLPILIRLIYQLVMMMHSFFTRNWKHPNQDDVIMQRKATSLSNSQASSSSSLSLSSNTSSAIFDKIITDSSSTAATSPSSSPTPNHKLIRTTLQRLLFYFLLLNIRGWGLYVGANALEDYVILPWITGNTVVSRLRTNSMSDVEHDLHYGDNNEPECWYEEVLKARHKSAMENDGHSDCYGRPFDFSDHVVLFLAHYLPIFVMEMLLCYSFPFWGPPVTEKAATKQRQSAYFLSKGMIWNVLHVFLFLYLHLLVLHALYQTAVYFHTPAEMLVGYGVSLMLQLPVGYLMCSEGWHRVKRCIGLPCEGGTMSDKGD